MVVANATTAVVLQSMREAMELNLVQPILVGPKDEIQQAADEIGWDLSDCDIEIAGDEHKAASIATALAASGQAGAVVKGHVHSDVLMRAALDSDTGLRSGSLMSHLFHMSVPGRDKAICIADAVLNVMPDVERKFEIILNSIRLLTALGISMPRVAVLSATEIETSAMPSSLDAGEIQRRAIAGELPGVIVEGPLALDVAVSQSAAESKGVTGEISGDADLLIVPNVETGNVLFKSLVHFCGAVAAGVVLGARVPIVLTSRADSVESRVASIALAAICSASPRQIH